MAVEVFSKLVAAAALAAFSSPLTAANVGSVEGSTWRIVAVDGERSPSRSYIISFGGDMVTGHVGCNDFGGNLKSSSGEFQISRLRATSRVCGDTAATFEGGAYAIMAQSLRMDWKDADHMTLSSSNGSMDLERVR